MGCRRRRSDAAAVPARAGAHRRRLRSRSPHAVGAGRRVVAPDYAGRGESGRSADVPRYAPEACLRDVLDICAALHLHQAIAIGTSFGGLLCMGIAAARPSLLRGVVLNDVGPEIGSEGGDFVRTLRRRRPGAARPRRLRRPSARAAAAPVAGHATQPGGDGRADLCAGRWTDGCIRSGTPRIARLLQAPAPPDLWPLFGALAHCPLLLVRGEASDILLPATVAADAARRGPDMTVVIAAGHRPRADAGRAAGARARCGRSWSASGEPAVAARHRFARWLSAGFGIGFAPRAGHRRRRCSGWCWALPLLLAVAVALAAAAAWRSAGGVLGDPRRAGRRRSRLGGDRRVRRPVDRPARAGASTAGRACGRVRAVPALRRDQARPGRLGRSSTRRAGDHGGRPDRRGDRRGDFVGGAAAVAGGAGVKEGNHVTTDENRCDARFWWPSRVHPQFHSLRLRRCCAMLTDIGA